MKDYKEFYDKITGFISKSPKRIRLLNLADKAMEMIMYAVYPCAAIYSCSWSQLCGAFIIQKAG